ncbi:hypothetical protein QOL99_06570 [Deinococcus sp. MIMF12]|uniref:YbjN domain-containing protein n=1 Tax=Deinococcus rhizophilus TaxID=3049544 RepID=A0ABT7JFI3_9DEIO|nr:hypothetical protein [Deinococcus rhizophilus]MDL2343810.1 hypothetical protein [Deinococcus rhizophilus]
MNPLVKELIEKLGALDIETAYEEEVLFAVIRGGASLPDDGLELALSPLELGPRALAVRAQHFLPLPQEEVPDLETLRQRLEEVREECVFARSVVFSDDGGEGEEPVLLTDASFLLSDLRPAQIQLLLTGLTLFAEEVLLTIGTVFGAEEDALIKEKN